jgi:hypothetical protein
MSARFLYDLVDPAVLTEYVRAFDNEVLRNQMGLETFLPNSPNPELEYRINRAAFRDVDVAEFRAFDTQPKMTGRQGFSQIRGELVPLSRQIPLTEEEILRMRAMGSAQGNRGLIDQIYNDAERMVRSVQMRLEVARGQVLTTGKFTLAENGLVLEADFGMAASHKPTTAISWALPGTADPLLDLLTWTQLYVDDNGFEPGAIVCSRTALGYMLNNTKMREAAAFAGTTPSRINLETVAAIFAANGLPPVTLYDTKARINGVSTPIIPVDKVLLLPPDGVPLGKTHYGITAEAIKLQGKGMITESAMPGIVAINLENDNPVQTFTLATAVAVPVLGDPNAVICADIIP